MPVPPTTANLAIEKTRVFSVLRTMVTAGIRWAALPTTLSSLLSTQLQLLAN